MNHQALLTPAAAIREINRRTGLRLSESLLYDHLDEIPTVEIMVKRIRIRDLPDIIELIRAGFAAGKLSQVG